MSRILRDHGDHGAGGHTHGGEPEPAGGPVGPVDPAQESLVGALRASFNVLRVLMIVLIVLYAFSGLFLVGPGEQGLIARFGVLREAPSGGYTFGPKLYVSLPDPFDTKIKLTGQVQTVPVTTFMFAHEQAATSKNLSEIIMPKNELQPGIDGAMFTGDRNLSHGRWEVQYRIVDAAAFVRSIGEDPNALVPLLTRLTETAVVREVAGRTVEEVTREALDQVRGGVKRRLENSVATLGAGVSIVDVVAYTIEPGAVREAFMDVSKAEQERATLESQASAKATETLSRAAGQAHSELLAAIRAYGAAQLEGADQSRLDARLAEIDAKLLEAEQTESGQVAIRLRQARSDADSASNRLRQQYDEFANYLEQRKARPLITALDLWNKMRAVVLNNRANEVFVVPDSNVIEILVNRDPVLQKEREEEEIMRRQNQPR
jgi:membrane protease subunit HflK